MPLPPLTQALLDHPALAVISGLARAAWVTDVDSATIVWANAAALDLWQADSLEELVTRDTGSTTETARTALRQARERVASGRRLHSQRTIYPKGVATRTNLHVGGFELPDGRGALLVEGELLDDELVDPDVLRRSEAARYARLAISTHDLEGRTLTQNVAATETFGLHFDIRSICARPADADAVLASLSGGRPFEGEVLTNTPGGTRWHAICARPLVDAVTGARGLALTAVDVTARREAEALKEAFFADVRHELRTPMTAVTSALDMALDHGPERRAELLQLARRNAQRLLELVDDLLDARHVATGALEVVTRELELDVLVREAVALDQPLFDFCGVALELVPATRRARVRADRRRFGQVLSNLLTNALKYSPYGGTVTVSVHVHLGRAAISIDDQGPGVPPDERDRIFERGVHGDRPERGGTGIGLYVARAVIDSHAGEVRCEDAPGGGARFVVILPTLGEAPAASAS